VKRILITFCTLLVVSSAFAQDPQDLDRRLKALEEKIAKLQPSPDIAELRREIDVLSREIESLKNAQQPKATTTDVAAVPSQTYGLGVAASKVYRAEQGVSFGGYGEFAYGKQRGSLARADVLRAVLYAGYKFSNRALFNSELEVENASTEVGGNVNVEFAYLDYLLKPIANVRAGLVLMPVGLINEQHEPTAYLGARRPLTETVIIPATWSELGAGVFGDAGRWSYRGYLTTGLRGSQFTGAEGIRSGRQGGGNAVAEDFAVVGRVDFHPFEGTMIGGSLYSGNSGQGRRTGSDRRIRGRVSLAEVHADSRFRGATVRAVFARGTAKDAQLLSDAVDPVGRSFGGWYIEGGYDLGSNNVSVTPYIRYERADTQRRAALGFTRNPEHDQRIFTAGMAWKPIPQTVLKVDFEKVKNAASTGHDRVNVGLGYIF
jgi:hypothetical protein